MVRYERIGQLNIAEIGYEKAILDVNTGKYHVLNKMGTEIYNMIDEQKSIQEIVNVLLDRYDVQKDICLNEVEAYINLLCENGIVARVEVIN